MPSFPCVGNDGHDAFRGGGTVVAHLETNHVDVQFNVCLVVHFKVDGAVGNVKFVGNIEIECGEAVGNVYEAVSLSVAGSRWVIGDPDNGAVEMGGKGGGLKIVFAEDGHLAAGLVGGLQGPEVFSTVIATEVGDAVGSDGDVVEFDIIVEEIVYAGGGNAVLLNNGVGAEVFHGALAQNGDGAGKLEGAKVGLTFVALKIADELNSIDIGIVETGLRGGGVLCLWHHNHAVEMDVCGNSNIPLEFLAAAESQGGNEQYQQEREIISRKSHILGNDLLFFLVSLHGKIVVF